MVRPANFEHVKLPGMRGRVAVFIEKAVFVHFITAVILVNAVTLGLETNQALMASQAGIMLDLFDKIALTIFVIEIALKLYAYRISFFRQGWNIFDFVVVGVSLVPAVAGLSVLRTLRVLRVLRLVSVVPQMRRVVAALFHAIPGMASILAVLLVIFYVAAVLATSLFGGAPGLEHLFGSISASLFTLFQVMTLEGWPSEVARPVMAVYPWAWIFFIPFIVVTTFAVLNLFIGIIVDAINYVHDREAEVHIGTDPDLHKDLSAARRDIRALKDLIEKSLSSSR